MEKNSQAVVYRAGPRAREIFQMATGAEEDAGEFTITSSDACVAAATISCWHCHADTEVICVHCETGMVSGEMLSQFTVSGA